MEDNEMRLTLTALLLVCSPGIASEPMPDPLAAGWKGEPVCEALIDDEVQRVLRCTFAPGVGHERHFHVPHFGYAVSGGRIQIRDASRSKTLDLEAGSYFNSDGVEWHEALNVGDTTVTYLVFEVKRRISAARWRARQAAKF